MDQKRKRQKAKDDFPEDATSAQTDSTHLDLDEANIEGDFVAHDKHVSVDIHIERASFIMPDARSTHDDVSSAPPFPPHNLPPRGNFTGRDGEKAHVHEALRSPLHLISIDGIGGIGKTALALEVAYECLRASSDESSPQPHATFDAIIWISAQDRELTLDGVLDTIARTLDYPGIAQQPTEEKRYAIRKLLQSHHYLTIVDNLETISTNNVQEFLLNLPETGKTLITTREQKPHNAQTLSLKGLADSEALEMIRNEGRHLQLASVDRAEKHVLLELYRVTGGAPLAIKWAIGQIKQKGQALDTVLQALREARGDVFDKIYTRSWALLSGDARQLLSTLPVFATSASRAGILAVSDLADTELDGALGQLVEMSLVDASDELELAHRRYSIHPLTRAFATAKSDAQPETRSSVQYRLAHYLDSFTLKHGGFWNKEGFDYIELELPNILTAIQWFWDQSLDRPVANILNNIIDFLIIRGYWNDLIALGERAVELAAQSGDELSAARVRTKALAWIERHRGELESARAHLQWSLPVFRQHNEDLEYFYAQRNLGYIAIERGEYDEATQLLQEALTYFQSVGDERHIYLTTANLAKLALKIDDLDDAWSLCDGVIESARKFDDPERIASLLKVMGRVAFRRSEYARARQLWSECLTQVKRADRPDEIAESQFRLAQVELKLGHTSAAKHMLLSALETYRRMELPSRIREINSILSNLIEVDDSAQ